MLTHLPDTLAEAENLEFLDLHSNLISVLRFEKVKSIAVENGLHPPIMDFKNEKVKSVSGEVIMEDDLLRMCLILTLFAVAETSMYQQKVHQ